MGDIYIGSGSNFIKIDATTGNRNTINGGTAHCLATNKDNIKWAGWGYGVGKYDGYNWQTGIIYDPIECIATDKKGHIWVGTYRDNITGSGRYGLRRFNGSTWSSVWTTATDPDLLNDTITCIGIDNQDNIWIGTNSGINVINNGTQWGNKIGSPTPVTCIALESNGDVWIGTRTALNKITGTQITSYRASNSGLIDDWILSVAVDKKGNKWIGCYLKGVCVLLDE